MAQLRYAQSVAEGVKASSPWLNLKGQAFLGDEQFVQRMQAHLQSGKDDVQIPVAQRRSPPAQLEEIEARAPDRNAAIVAAYATGGYSYQHLADFFGVHFTTVGKIVRGGG
jgi:alpha-beta hydrolase superfamily lysophospholipase